MSLEQPKRQGLYLVDTTLRDGEQAPGVAFTQQEKLDIATRLERMGLDELEIGVPANGTDEVNAIRHIVAAGLDCRLSVWCRALARDIELAAESQAQAVHISLPVSDIQLKTLGKTRSWALRSLYACVKQARRQFGFVSIGAQDASRADMDFLVTFAQETKACGAHRLRFADTVGICDPFQLYLALMRLRAKVPDLELGFHGHNDLGMATANALAAFKAGAKCVDVTVNGLGERAGNTPLAEIVMAGRVCADLDLHIETRQLIEVAELVARASGRPIPIDKPIIGRGTFVHESGVHIRALLEDEASYEPFSPELLGQNERSFVLGKHSGRSALHHALAQQGLRLSESKLALLLVKIKAHAMETKRTVSMDELVTLYWSLA